MRRSGTATTAVPDHHGTAIARAATAWDADVVVLGTRRPGRWEALVAGSTLHDVLRLSDRPVLVAGH